MSWGRGVWDLCTDCAIEALIGLSTLLVSLVRAAEVIGMQPADGQLRQAAKLQHAALICSLNQKMLPGS